MILVKSVKSVNNNTTYVGNTSDLNLKKQFTKAIYVTSLKYFGRSFNHMALLSFHILYFTQTHILIGSPCLKLTTYIGPDRESCYECTYIRRIVLFKPKTLLEVPCHVPAHYSETPTNPPKNKRNSICNKKDTSLIIK